MLKYGSFLFVIVCLSANTSPAQNYNNPGGTITACSGNFYDTGGPLGSYLDGENIITTFCPTAANKCLSITFTSFDLELNFDELEIYDGPTSSYPLVGTYSGTNSPGTVTAHNGCLTFIFNSDFSIAQTGWQANIDCVPCPPPPPCTGTIPACASSPPDVCSGACNLGTLNPPPACPSTSSSVNVFCLSNIGATASTPYLYLNGCQPSGNNMAAPAADVWYTFIASSNIIDVDITGLSNPNLGLYEGTDCSTFIGRGCAVGAFGNLSATFQPIQSGRKYYLQISGGDSTETSDFSLTVTGRNDCDPCVINANLSASPLPINGIYQSGTTVHFCLTITQWNPTSVNWLHAIVPTFDGSWDMSSLVLYSPPSCDGNGNWKWYNSVTSSQTGVVTGPGFFYESILGCTVCNSNNPGDNYGDNCTGAVNFVFCWDITVAPCVSGNSLNVSVNTFGDGETGSWTNYACAADPVFDFFATCTSCPEPTLKLKHVACHGESQGRAIVRGQGVSPFSFTWRDSLGNILRSSPNIIDYDTLDALPAGRYSIEQLDAGQCFNTADFIIEEPSQLVSAIAASSVSCNGLNDGAIDITLSGGVSPYEYSLDGITFQNANSFSGLGSGMYILYAQDDSNCVVAQTAVITEPDVLAITPNSIMNSSCSSSNNGAINITVSGGTLPYSFSWSNTASTEDISALPGGDYRVTVTDPNGCVAIDSFSLVNNPDVSLSAASSNVQCYGGSDGSIDLTVSGGTLPFMFSWSNAETVEDLTGVSAGNYSVTVFDINQCSDSITVVITEPAAIILSGITTNLACYGDNSGAIDLAVSGGVSPFSFVWSNNATSEDISSVAAGNYFVTATDSNSCTAITSFLLTQPDSITLSYTQTDVSCNGGNDGSVDLSVFGGTLPYQFIWSNNETTEDIAGLSGNVYDVIVIDSNLCVATSSVTINEPAPLVVTGIVSDVLCNGGNSGQITITTSGGVSPYFYLWSNSTTSKDLTSVATGSYYLIVADSNQCSDTSAYDIMEPPAIVLSASLTNLACNVDSSGAIDLNVSGGIQPYFFTWSDGAASEDITSVPAGNYSLTLTDNNSCSATSSFTLTQPDTIILSHVQTDVSCAGWDDGSINLSVSNGTVPFQFLWSNNETTEDLFGLSADVYDVIVTDSNLCIATSSITINEPAPLVVNGIVTDVLCNGENSGAVNITVNGAVTPYNYQWSNSTNSEDLIAVTADSYSVIVTDANQCADTATFTVMEPAALLLSGNISDLACNVDSSGAIDLTASGGVQPYSFLWSDGATSEDIAGIATGNYLVTTTDANQCWATSSFPVTQPDSIILSHVDTDVSCAGGNDGAINLTVTSGTLPFQFLWSTGAATEDLSGLVAMTYHVTVNDSNSCSANASITINEPMTLTVAGAATDVLCNTEASGKIIMTTSGGVSPYSYQWSNGATLKDLNGIVAGNYIVTVSDANQCADILAFVIDEPLAILLNGVVTNLLCHGDDSGEINLTATGGVQPFSFTWSNNAVIEDISNIAAGIYLVTATDGNSCTATTSFAVTQPDSISISLLETDVNCAGGNDGAIDLSVNGGALPYQFIWSNNEITEDITGLAAATYDVIVLDINACSATASFTIDEPSPLNVTGVVTDVLCNHEASGEINTTATGGVAPYNFQWSNAAAMEDLIAVIAGNYSLTVTDINNCTAITAFILNEPDTLKLSGFATDARCFTSRDGEISLSASGGTLPYEFSIGAQFQPAPTFINITGGNYQSVVRDANSCTDTINLVINTPPEIATVVSTDSVSCFGGIDGDAIVTALGVNGPFTFLWSNNSTNDTASNLAQGVYYVTITDNNNCLAFDTAIVGQPSSILLSGTIADVLCNGGNSGSILLNVSGGIPSYTYLWSGNQTTQDIDSLKAGNYSVTISDNNSCTASDSYSVTEPSALILTASSIPVICHGDSNGIASVSAQGGTPGYDYQWDVAAGNQTTSSAINLAAGIYEVVVSDMNNCSATINAEITEPQLLVVVIDTSRDPLCERESSGLAGAAASGGTGAVSYRWSNVPPANGAMMTGVRAGTYEVTATDGNGCTASASITLNEPPPLSVFIIPRDTTIVYGDSVTLQAVHAPAGLVPSYVWEPSNLPLWCVSPCADPIVAPTDPTTFTVYLTVQGSNCSASAQAFVDVVFENDVQTPNAFSPDGDGVNDEFEVFFSPSLTGITYMVFNRWGEKLFETHTIGEYWDGTYRGEPLNPGVYVYWVEGEFLDGEKKHSKGSLTLLR